MSDGQGNHDPASDANGLPAGETIILRDSPEGLARARSAPRIDRIFSTSKPSAASTPVTDTFA